MVNRIFSNYWILLAGLWLLGSGVLHDIFVWRNHKGPYDRELLKLLMDGHVLILSGILFILCFWMFQSKIPAAAVVGIIVAMGMLVYCAMIFPFLKAFGTIAICLAALIVCVRKFRISK